MLLNNRNTCENVRMRQRSSSAKTNRGVRSILNNSPLLTTTQLDSPLLRWKWSHHNSPQLTSMSQTKRFQHFRQKSQYLLTELKYRECCFPWLRAIAICRMVDYSSWLSCDQRNVCVCINIWIYFSGFYLLKLPIDTVKIVWRHRCKWGYLRESPGALPWFGMVLVIVEYWLFN